MSVLVGEELRDGLGQSVGFGRVGVGQGDLGAHLAIDMHEFAEHAVVLVDGQHVPAVGAHPSLGVVAWLRCETRHLRRLEIDGVDIPIGGSLTGALEEELGVLFVQLDRVGLPGPGSAA